MDTTLATLAMSQTKDDLLRHLNLSQETYVEMAKLTDHVYHWLTSEKRHLKDNCKRKPPYDWSDIVEKAKDKAMEKIARSGDVHVRYYWDLAVPTPDCPNWIAKWFLYHKFRYRDGRNRNGKGESSSSSRFLRKHHRPHNDDANERDGSYDQQFYAPETTTTYGQEQRSYSYATTAAPTTTAYAYSYAAVPQYGTQAHAQSQASSGTYYDPVRDMNM